MNSENTIESWRQKALALGRVAISALFVTLFLVVVSDYLHTQMKIRERLPSTHYSFLPDLGKSPFKHASFVMDNYAGPVVAYTDQWAYYDPIFSSGEIKLTENGFEVSRDFRHLWSKDQLVNPVYKKPDYFLCMSPQTPVNSAINRNAKGLPYGCSKHPIAVKAMGGQDVLQHQIVARDAAKDSWMIIKLDWSFPPYLTQKTIDGEWYRWTVLRPGNKDEEVVFRVDYEYAQQDAEPENGTTIRMYRVGKGNSCSEGMGNLELLVSTAGERHIALPDKFSGKIVLSVTPATTVKKGFEYFSEIIRVSAADAKKIEACPYVPAPLTFLNAFAIQEGSSIRAFWSPVKFATDYLVELRENEGDWFLASAIKAPKSEFGYQIVEPKAGYSLRIKPCNGNVCGSYSMPIKTIRLAK